MSSCTSNDPICHADNCGNGFGNWVGVLHEDGELTLYAHLAEVFVEQGQSVQVGEPLGVEGTTGMAGTRHLHFSVHRTPLYCEGKRVEVDTTVLEQLSFPYDYPTVPYFLLYREAESKREVTIDIRCFRNLDWDRNYRDEPRMFAIGLD